MSWIKLKNFPNYAISNTGKVRNLATGLMLRQHIQKKYCVVYLYKNGKRTSKKVHSLVCVSFIGDKPFEKAEVCHKNGIHTDNIDTNLRWGTRKSNANDARAHGTLRFGEKINTAILNISQVLEIRKQAGEGVSFVSLSIRYGVRPKTIGKVVHHHTWKHV